MATSEQQMPFVRDLAASDRRVREKALSSLRTYLTAQKTLDRLTALKLWKGLFYGMWMCDKPIPQQRLAGDLGELHTALPGATTPTDPHQKDSNENVPTWFHAAWEVLSESWTEIDVLRLEKFLLLVRRLFAAHLKWVASKGWARDRQDIVIQLLAAWPCESEGDMRRVPLGLRLHILDVWVDEMEKMGMLGGEKGEEEDEDEAEDAEALAFALRMKNELIDPLTGCPVKEVRKHSREELEDDRLPWNTKGHGDGDENGEGQNGGGEDDDEWSGFGD